MHGKYLLKLIWSYDRQWIFSFIERLEAWCTIFLVVDLSYRTHAFSYFKSACVENPEEICGGEQQNETWLYVWFCTEARKFSLKQKLDSVIIMFRLNLAFSCDCCFKIFAFNQTSVVCC